MNSRDRLRFQKNAEAMVDIEKPEVKGRRILARESFCEPRRRPHLEIIDDRNRAHRRVTQSDEERVLPLRRIRRTVHQHETGGFQPLQHGAMRRDIERLDQPQPVPALRQRHDDRVISRSFRQAAFQQFGVLEPIARILDRGDATEVVTKHMRRTAGAKFERRAARREDASDLGEEFAARRRQDPPRHRLFGATRSKPGDDLVKPVQQFFRGVALTRFNYNRSTLLSASAHGTAISLRSE
jgi:hypothetical protein